MRFSIVLGFAFGAGAGGDGWVSPDKWRHLLASAGLHSVTWSVARAAGASPSTAQAIAIPVAAGVGLGKELLDRHRGTPHDFSHRDVVWDAGGIALSVIATRSVAR